MTINLNDTKSALALFKEAAIKHSEATENGDSKLANKNYSAIINAVSFLKEHNKLQNLNEFLNYPLIGVRIWAATYLLPINEKEAVAVLEELSRRTDIFSLDAKTTLNEWRKGNLKL